MDQNDSLKEVASRDEQTDEQPQRAPQTEPGGSGESIPLPSVSKQQALVLAGIAVVVVLLYVRSRSSSSGSAAETTQAARERAAEKREVEIGEEGEAKIVLPENPDEVTEYDAAIIKSDVFSVVGGGGD